MKNSDPQFIPQVIAQKCPVCNGFGTLSKEKIICHACKGKGYIVLRNNYSFYEKL